MRIITSKKFESHYTKWVEKRPDIRSSFRETLILFQKNPHSPRLRIHKLSGKLKGYWFFSIGYDLRVVF